MSLNQVDQILYHSVQPNNVKQYRENENIDFTLAFEGRKLVANSVRYEAELFVSTNAGGTVIAPAQDVKIDPKIGGHAFVANYTTSFQNVGVVENLTSAPRMVRMMADGTMSQNDMFNTDMVCELRSASDIISRKQILQKIPSTYCGGDDGLLASITESMKSLPDFSIKIPTCVNNLVGANQAISYAQSGAIQITLTTERNLGALYGASVDNAYYYELRNSRMTFKSVPDDGNVSPITMKTSLCLKNSLSSAVNNLSSKVPAICSAVSLSFLQQSRENQALFCNTDLVNPPNVKKLTFLFNDAFNKFITYEIKDKVDMIDRGIDSMNSDGSNDCSLENVSANLSTILGLNWDSAVDLSDQKFNINIETDITNTNPFIMFSYFHSLKKI